MPFCCTPPPPLLPECVCYPNALGEREWHSVKKTNRSDDGNIVQQNEMSQYQRTVKSCNPCSLPQSLDGRTLVMPASHMRPNEADEYSPEKPPCPENLPDMYAYSEDKGECNKRQTVGPGPYVGYGCLLPTPMCGLGNIPCGYYYREQQLQCNSKAVSLPESTLPLPRPSSCPECPPRLCCGPPPCPSTCYSPPYSPCTRPQLKPC